MTTMKELERKINELDKRTDDKCDKYFDNADRLGRVESVLTVMTIFLIVAVAASLVALAHDTPSLPSGYEEVCVEWMHAIAILDSCGFDDVPFVICSPKGINGSECAELREYRTILPLELKEWLWVCRGGRCDMMNRPRINFSGIENGGVPIKPEVYGACLHAELMNDRCITFHLERRSW